MVHTCVRGTPLSCPNTLTLNMTATADGAQFIPRGEVATRGAQHFRSDMCKGRGYLSEVSFILWSLYVHKWLDLPPHKEVWRCQVREFPSHGMCPSQPHQWFLHASSRNSGDFRGLWIILMQCPLHAAQETNKIKQFAINFCSSISILVCERTIYINM
jgi:hypothetical protein